MIKVFDYSNKDIKKFAKTDEEFAEEDNEEKAEEEKDEE